MADDRPHWSEQNQSHLKGGDRTNAATKDLWLRCPGCSEILYRPSMAERSQMCLHCGHHFRLGARERIALLIDPGSWQEHDAHLRSTDPLGFVDSKPYAKRIVQSQAKTGESDALVAGTCRIGGMRVELASFNFRFMGGSMGSVVGEGITRCFERAIEARCPAIVISASGGARMQEGILSLMQMAKSCAALARLRDEVNQPYISILTDPTTGGVAASFAMLGDLILAEPNALIGFAGPRVIEQTIGQSLPDDFQTSEYLLEHGMIDMIVSREQLRAILITQLSWFGAEAVEVEDGGAEAGEDDDPAAEDGAADDGADEASPA